MKLFALMYFSLLRLRYKFQITWFDNIDSKKKYIVFPNHQALVDPQIVVSLLNQKIHISPVISETYYNIPVLKYFFRLIWAVSMWDIQKWTGSIEDVHSAFRNIEEWMKSGKNILLYPAWQLYSQGFEVIRGKKSAYNLVQILPDNVEILVVKTTWLWWSMWSKAWIGDTPNFFTTFFKTIGIIISNLLLLIPKRNVKVEIVNMTKELKVIKDINTFNKTLEDFYNKDWAETIKYNKHFFYYNNINGKKEPGIVSWSIEEQSLTSEVDEKSIPEEVIDIIKEKIAEMKEISKDSFKLKSNLINDLYFDSLDASELKAFVQNKFSESSNPPILDLKTVWDLCVMAIWKSAKTEEIKPCNWIGSLENEQTIYEILEKYRNKLGENTSIVSLFKESFKSGGKSSFVYDNIFWVQSKKDFVIKAFLIASYLKKIEWKYIWIMLPSVSSSSLILIATYLAGKIPVMLNWTVWETALLHCVKFANVDNILTSKSFYDKIKNSWTEKIGEKYLYLEDLLKNVPINMKISALIRSYLFIIPKIKYTDEAVLLFTSWSESLPKAVSLSHRNIISDIIWALYHFPITNKDVLIWFLPPFHSFWFSINTIMPLISGLKVAYTPDPNDSKTIADLVWQCGITALTATPTFLNMIISSPSWSKLQWLKYAVVGAEKCPDNLFAKFGELCPQGKILEWYGITECSPVISINPPIKSKKWSVGLAIKWSEVKIISLDTNEERKPWEQWMIYFAWDNVFNWYLDANLEKPFDIINGKNYYKTWDLWYLDEDWYLYITGRLKRFIKIAWEMISLPFIEWILNKKYWANLAIEAKESEWNTKIVLFTTENIDLADAQNYLRDNWVSNLVKLSEVQTLESLPVLWTGKLDYKVLKAMI